MLKLVHQRQRARTAPAKTKKSSARKKISSPKRITKRKLSTVTTYPVPPVDDISVLPIPLRRLLQQPVTTWPVDQPMEDITTVHDEIQGKSTKHKNLQNDGDDDFIDPNGTAKPNNQSLPPADALNHVFFRPFFPTNPLQLSHVGEITMPHHLLLAPEQFDDISSLLTQAIIHNKYFFKRDVQTGHLGENMTVYNPHTKDQVLGDILRLFKEIQDLNAGVVPPAGNEDLSIPPYYLLQGSYDNFRQFSTRLRGYVDRHYSSKLSHDMLLFLFDMDNQTDDNSTKDGENVKPRYKDPALTELLQQRFNSLITSFILSRILVATDCNYNFIHINMEKHPKIPVVQHFYQTIEEFAPEKAQYKYEQLQWNGKHQPTTPLYTTFMDTTQPPRRSFKDKTPEPISYYRDPKHQAHNKDQYQQNFCMNNPKFNTFNIHHGFGRNNATAAPDAVPSYPSLAMSLASVPKTLTPFINIFPLPFVQSIIASGSSTAGFAIPSTHKFFFANSPEGIAQQAAYQKAVAEANAKNTYPKHGNNNNNNNNNNATDANGNRLRNNRGGHFQEFTPPGVDNNNNNNKPREKNVHPEPPKDHKNDVIALQGAFNVFTPTRTDYVNLFNKHIYKYMSSFMTNSLQSNTKLLKSNITTTATSSSADQSPQTIQDLNVLEIGVGTGALSVSIIDTYLNYMLYKTNLPNTTDPAAIKTMLKQRPGLSVIGTEINSRALYCAKENVAQFLHHKSYQLQRAGIDTKILYKNKLDVDQIVLSDLYQHDIFTEKIGVEPGTQKKSNKKQNDNDHGSDLKNKFDVILFNVPWLPFSPRDGKATGRRDDSTTANTDGNEQIENNNEQLINNKQIDTTALSASKNSSIDTAVYDTKFNTLHQFLLQSKKHLKQKSQQTQNNNLQHDNNDEIQTFYDHNTNITDVSLPFNGKINPKRKYGKYNNDIDDDGLDSKEREKRDLEKSVSTNPQIWLLLSTLFMDLGFVEYLPRIINITEEEKATLLEKKQQKARDTPPPQQQSRITTKRGTGSSNINGGREQSRNSKLMGIFEDEEEVLFANKNGRDEPNKLTSQDLFNYYIEKTSGCRIVDVLTSRSHNKKKDVAPGKLNAKFPAPKPPTPLQKVRETEEILFYILEPIDDNNNKNGNNGDMKF